MLRCRAFLRIAAHQSSHEESNRYGTTELSEKSHHMCDVDVHHALCQGALIVADLRYFLPQLESR
ncbi:MAG: hypothetical protein JWQ15_2170 [Marmoricola sp.]|jgi:hypothetical protein|nr:hypothetical protein [Marmoricola sp.]